MKLNTIWIVECGFTDLSGYEMFSAAYTSKDRAVQYARDQAQETVNDMGELGADESVHIVVTYNDNGSVLVELEQDDWWVIREVPLG